MQKALVGSALGLYGVLVVGTMCWDRINSRIVQSRRHNILSKLSKPSFVEQNSMMK